MDQPGLGLFPLPGSETELDDAEKTIPPLLLGKFGSGGGEVPPVTPHRRTCKASSGSSGSGSSAKLPEYDGTALKCVQVSCLSIVSPSFWENYCRQIAVDCLLSGWENYRPLTTVLYICSTSVPQQP